MPTGQATALATRLLESYPGRTIGLGNIEAIAETLDTVGLDIAGRVVEDLRQYCADPPSVAQVHDVADDVRRSAAIAVPDHFQRPELRGRELTPAEFAHGMYHLVRSMDGAREWDRARRPWECTDAATEAASIAAAAEKRSARGPS